VDVPAVETLHMLSLSPGEPSSTVRERVIRARNIQSQRFTLKGLNFRTNADISGEALFDIVQLTNDARSLLEKATETFKLSMRGYTRVLRVARTIADLAMSEHVQTPHVAEAIAHRQRQSALNEVA
jgi:magnesium chelatase family protein